MILKVEIEIKKGNEYSDKTIDMIEQCFVEIVSAMEELGKSEGVVTRDGVRFCEWGLVEEIENV